VTPRYPIFWTERGHPIRCRLIRRGDRYGPGWAKTHDDDDPLVEFYDAKYGLEDCGSRLGMFTPERFRISELRGRGKNEGPPVEHAHLDLCLMIDAWRLDESVTVQLMRWLRYEEKLERAPELFLLWCDVCSTRYDAPDPGDVEVNGFGSGPMCPECGEERVVRRLAVEVLAPEGLNG
jgi:hypothetical protein